jgi:RNAse (barnase) inhibitor barstar
MTRLTTLLNGSKPPGMYRWLSRAHPAAISRQLESGGWQLHVLEGGQITNAPAFFDECARVLEFPAWFGRNWDALADCLSDLSWLPATTHVLLWERHRVLAKRDPVAWRNACEVMAEKAAESGKRGVPPLYVLLRGDGPADTLPLL